MFEIVSIVLRYLFTTIIYLFLFWIIRIIYLDIRTMNDRASLASKNLPYLKLVNRSDSLDFKVEETYILEGDKTIGRLDKNDIAIQDPFLSGEHSRLLLINGKYSVEDLGSKNGTFINGENVTGSPAALKNGDMIQVGQLTFLFVENI